MHAAAVATHWPPAPPDALQLYGAAPAPPDPLVDFGGVLNLAPPHLSVASAAPAHSLAPDGWSAPPQSDYGLSGGYPPAFSPPLEPSPFLLLSSAPTFAHPPFLSAHPPPQPAYRQLYRLTTTTTATTATTTALEHALTRAHAPPQPQLPHGLHPHTPPRPFAPAPLYADHAPAPPPEPELGWPSSAGEGASGSASSGSGSSGEWDAFVALLEGGGGGGIGSGEPEMEGFPPGWAEGEGTGLGGSVEGMLVDEGDGIDWSLAGPTIPPPPSPSAAAPGPLAWLAHPPPRSPAPLVPLELFLPAPLAAPPAQQPPADPAAPLGPLDAQLAALFPALVSSPTLAPHPPFGQLAHFASHDALPLIIPGSDAPPAAAVKPRGQARPSLFAPPFGPARGVSAHEAAIGGFPVVALPPDVGAGLPASKPQVEKVPRRGGLARPAAPAHPASRSHAIAAGDANAGGAYVPPPGLRRALTAPASAPAPAPPRPALFRPEGAPVGGLRRGDEWYSASEFWAPWKAEGALVDAEGKEVPLLAEIETPASFVFDNEIDAWLTYRRNFLSLRVTLSLPLGVPLSALRLSKDGSAAPIDHLEATLSAHMFPKGTPVELLQFDAARTLCTAQPVSPAPLALVDPASAVPGAFSTESIPVDDADGPPLEQHHRASFARVQFRSSTANGPAAHSRLKLAAGGADDARFVVRCCVRAVRADGSRADVGGWESAALCVRGRSPGNFGGGKGAAGVEGKKAKGKRARKAPAEVEDDEDDDEDGGEYRDCGAAAKRARSSSSSSSQPNGADIVVGVAAGVVTRRRAAAAQKKKTKKPAVTAEGDLIV
ncbi:hypothetical protein JCM10449v2_006803 [Rhodotorula kratochvilovae]